MNDENIFKYENPNIIQYKVIEFDDMLPPVTPTPTPTTSAPTPTPTPTVTPVPATPTPTPTTSEGPTTHNCWRIERCGDEGVFYARKDEICLNGALAAPSYNFMVGDTVQFFNHAAGSPVCPGGATFCGEIVSSFTIQPTAKITLDQNLNAQGCSSTECTE